MIGLESLIKKGRLRLFTPAHIWVLIQDCFGVLHPPRNAVLQLRATVYWLLEACRQSSHGGVSDGYSISRGWFPPYPETTGYIIPTFFDYAVFANDSKFRTKAIELADWEIKAQLDSGAVMSGMLDTSVSLADAKRKAFPAVFNTGQVVQGWARAYLETKEPKYLEAAKRAGDWLLSMQDEDGLWRQGDSPIVKNKLRVYHTRVAWPLLQLWQETHDERYKLAAQKNLDWALSQQNENGWYANSSFDEEPPLTHTIGYTLEGMLESGLMLAEERYIQSVLRACEALRQKFESANFLFATYDENWQSKDKSSCLTGDAQIALVWLRIFQEFKELRFWDSAQKLIGFLKSTQNIASSCRGIRGGVKGSHPIFGGYAPYYFPNWAAKFFADALMLEEKLQNTKLNL